MSVFWIKIIAAASMLLDHTGMILFPEAAWMRILGRLALPLYALCIAEGFRHTRNRLKYFLRIFILGALCQVVYFFVSSDPYLGILITFSLSIVLLFLLDALLMACKGQAHPISARLQKLCKKKIPRAADISICALLLLAGLGGVILLNHYIPVDYGLSGILFPVLVYLGGSSRLGRFGGAAVGTVLGLGGGILLLEFVMSQIKVDMVWMFASLKPLSYLWAILLTVLSAVFVDFLLYFKLDKINMAEALKSVE